MEQFLNVKQLPYCPDSSDLGWYINLKNSQKLTAGVAIDNDQVHFPIYEPSASSTKCSLGLAIKGGAESECGKRKLYHGRYRSFV